MHKILRKDNLSEEVKLLELEAELIAKKRKPGQFVILQIDSKGERIPLTIAEANPDKGTITLIVQEVGFTTRHLGRLEVNDTIEHLAGPLGRPTEIKHYGKVVCIGGGVGNAVVYPIAKGLKEKGNTVYSIIGARTKGLIIIEDKMRDICDEVYITTDDGSYGQKGVVTDKLKELIETNENIDLVVAVGPVVMMKFVAEMTKKYNIKTIVSLNPIMIDGTGMCGGCRVKHGDETKFACVDGPEFDAHKVDFDNLIKRLATYENEERSVEGSRRKKENSEQ